MSIEYHHHIDSKQDNLSKFLKILEKNNFGYQIHAGQNTPFGLQIFEDIQIHAYNKGQYPYSSWFFLLVGQFSNYSRTID